MRIALVSMHTSPAQVPGSGDAGGMNVVVAEEARALAARGHEVVAVTRATDATPPGEYPLSTARVTGSVGAGRAPAIGSAPRLIALSAGAADLRKSQLPEALDEFAHGLRSLGPFDAVHAHYWLSAAAAQSAVATTGQRFVTTFHTLAALKNEHLAPGDAPEPELRVRAEQELARESFVVAGSRSELASHHRLYGEPPLGSAVVNPGVDTALFRPRVASSLHELTQPLRVTVLGRVQPLKGQDLAVRVFGELARTNPALAARSELVIAGEPTLGAEAYAAELRDIAGEYGISDRVRFLPAQSRSEAAALLASSAVVLVPSHSETFGLTALEAAACGVPVIAGGHTGLVEAAPHGTAGIHLRGRDPREWSRALTELLGDPQLRRTLGASAREHALTHDWNAHAASLERIYEQLV